MILNTRKQKWNLWKKLLIILAGILSILGISFGVYISDYYHADSYALDTLEHPKEGISLLQTNQNRLVWIPQDPIAAMIFYPGGKVQYEAYAPLMEACAERGILCILLRMPGNLAVLDVNAADGIPADYPDIHQWYLAGHSLGGAMAASYAGKHWTEYEGLVLLASYSTEDLSQSSLNVLSVYGTEDGVLNMDSYRESRKNLPDSSTEVVIQGGCHANFGCYGVQKGDGIPQITNKEQIRLTADAIAEMAASHSQ